MHSVRQNGANEVILKLKRSKNLNNNVSVVRFGKWHLLHYGDKGCFARTDKEYYLMAHGCWSINYDINYIEDRIKVLR